MSNDWLFNRLTDDELFEDGYFFNLSAGDIIEVRHDSAMDISDAGSAIISQVGAPSEINGSTNTMLRVSQLVPFLLLQRFLPT